MTELQLFYSEKVCGQNGWPAGSRRPYSKKDSPLLHSTLLLVFMGRKALPDPSSTEVMSMRFIRSKLIAERVAWGLEKPSPCLSPVKDTCFTRLALVVTFVGFAQPVPGRIPVLQTGSAALAPPHLTLFSWGRWRSQARAFRFKARSALTVKACS